MLNTNLQKVLQMSKDKGGVFDLINNSGKYPAVARKNIFAKGDVLGMHTLLARAAYLHDATMAYNRLHRSKEIYIGNYLNLHIRKGTMWKWELDRIIGYDNINSGLDLS
jgi:hypothetical protein